MESTPLASGAIGTVGTGEPPPDRQSMAIAALLDQIGRRADAAAWATGLHPAQWSALRYFSRAGAEARTVAAFAAFVGASLGTSWQTVKALIGKGYVTSNKMPGRGKVLRIDLTQKGRQRIADDPLAEIGRAVAQLDPTLRITLIEAAEGVLRRLPARGVAASAEEETAPGEVEAERPRPSIHPVPLASDLTPTETEDAGEAVIGFFPRGGRVSAPE
ncbi:MarR family winged helix-turn-helix transcriptional regulator [Elstera cyanobacteriorum]|uniref:MarR family winged helix-turn-helix transcriptional regulator n=1 Tax=Elstera cyanobacteriorum TaxID=2022747 RepID=UPI002356AD87|nr:MarR family winged helix-turn-helix transcriptional regulator [Elstera cyanobacteriorum]MCK6443932.1 MarR family winged helix-turn-helix transcriptional regulator [Elstera cyanobacteriorum]